MKQINNNQLFYIYDENGNKIGIKERHIVHKNGDWHRAVQLNLIHKNLLLVQKRSDQVDIAKGLFDQTLATQLIIEDEESDIKALSRGLKEELGLDINELNIKHISGPKKIINRYKYVPNLYNREFVSLYQAYFYKKHLKPISPKITSLFWKPINEIKKSANINPDKFTQTFLMWLKEEM